MTRDSDDNWFIKPGYAARTEVSFYEDSDGQSDVVWQPEVYEAAGMLARTSGADVIIDIGCGRAAKLVEITDTPTIGVDIGANIDWCRDHYPDRVWIEHDLESSLPLDLGRDFDRAVVVCADVIEHLLDPTQLLNLLQGYQRRNAIVLISTPDRDKVRGTADRGPPANPAHVREWNRDEFERMLLAYGFEPVAVGHTQERSDSPDRNTILATAYPSETPMSAVAPDQKKPKTKDKSAKDRSAMVTDAPSSAPPSAELDILRARAEAFQRELETARSRLRADTDTLIEARAEAARLQARYEVIKEAHDQRSSAVMDLERLRITLADSEHRIAVKDAYVAELEAARNQAVEQAAVKARLADELTKARDQALARITTLAAAAAEVDQLKGMLEQRTARLEALEAARSDDDAALEDARADAANLAHRLRTLEVESRDLASRASRTGELEAELAQVSQALAEKNARIGELEVALKDADHRIDIKDAYAAELEAARQVHFAQLEDARADAADVAHRLRTLQAETRSLASEANRAVALEAELAALQVALADLIGEERSPPLSNMAPIDQLRSVIEDLAGRSLAAEQADGLARSQLSQAKVQADTLQTELMTSRAEFEALQTELMASRAGLEALHTDLNTLPSELLDLLGPGGAAPPADAPLAEQLRSLIAAIVSRYGSVSERAALELELRQLKMRQAGSAAEALTLRDNAWRLGNRVTELEARNVELEARNVEIESRAGDLESQANELNVHLATVRAESDAKQQTLSELPWRVIGAYRRLRRFVPLPLLKLLAAMLPRRRHAPPPPPAPMPASSDGES